MMLRNYCSLLFLISALSLLSGCMPVSLTSGYSARSGVAEDLTYRGREHFISEAFEKSKEYTDKQIYQLKLEVMRMKEKEKVSQTKEEDDTQSL